MASVYYKGMFEMCDFTIPVKAASKKDLSGNSSDLLWQKVKEFMDSKDLVCSEIVTSEQQYQKGDMVVVEVRENGDELKVGVIETIVIKKEKVFLVLRTFLASKEYLGFFQSVSMAVEHCFTDVKSLADSKPLIRHGTDLRFQFVLHHNLSFDYDHGN